MRNWISQISLGQLPQLRISRWSLHYTNTSQLYRCRQRHHKNVEAPHHISLVTHLNHTPYTLFRPTRKDYTPKHSKMTILTEMTWHELIIYKLKLHHNHRDYNFIVANTKDANQVDKYNRLCERIDHTLHRVYDELTRRESDARRLNIKLY